MSQFGDGGNSIAPDGPGPPGDDDAQRLAGLSIDVHFLRTLIEESNRAFFIIDREAQNLLYISPAFDRIFGCDRRELYADGNKWYAMLHRDDVELCRRAVEDRMRNPQISWPAFEYRIHHPELGTRWIAGNVFLCRHGRTGETLLCGIAEDITTRKQFEFVRDRAQAVLEETVAQRTRELTAANALLREEIERRKDVEEQLLAKQAYLENTIRFHEWERKLWAVEIHEGAIQDVVAACMRLDAIGAGGLTESQRRHLTTSSELLRSVLANSRRTVKGMRPQTLDDLGVQATLEEVVAEQEAAGLAVALHCEVTNLPNAPMVGATIYYIVQEALTNVRLHAHVDRTEVELVRHGDGLRLTVRDTGPGFDLQSVDPRKFGLRGIRERATAVGGEAVVSSAPGRGTVVTVRLPLLDPVESVAAERDRVLVSLRSMRVRFQQILDETTAVIFVKDHRGRYEFINKRFEQLFHVRRETFLGKTDFDIHAPDVAQKVFDNDQTVLNDGRPQTFEETVPSDGEIREYVTVKFPIAGEGDDGRSICGIATDITEQKRHQRSIDESRARFETFMDNSPLLAWIKDAAGRYVFVNRRLLGVFGLQADQILGRTDEEVLPQGCAGPVREHDLEILASGGMRHFDEFCPVDGGPPLKWNACKFRLQAVDGSYLVGGMAVDATANGDGGSRRPE
jgi:PAS domain S-box-containing protein